MNLPRLLAAVILSGLAAIPPASAQSYPSKPVRVILPYPPGGAGDALLRAIAGGMSDGLKANFYVDNRPGANGIIGTEITAKSAPDGYTIMLGSTSSLPMNAAIYAKLPYDPIKDFAPISSFSYMPLVLVVHPALPVASVKEYIALAKARPSQITYASFGLGSVAHFGAELFGWKTSTKLVHVPYKGSGPAMVEMLGGHVMSCFDTVQSSMPHIRAKRLRPLGIATVKRSPTAPEIPTIAEAGVPDFEIGTLMGLLAPANTAREIVTKLNVEVRRVIALPEVTERMASVGTEPRGNTAEEFAAWIRSELAKWTEIARRANIRVD